MRIIERRPVATKSRPDKKMSINTTNPIDVFQDILDKCCEQHAQCIACPHLKSCRSLWDRASELTYSKPFTVEHLNTYIAEFNRFWENDTKETNIFSQN